MRFPRYPKYKPSGVKWLGEVPAHWGVDRLKLRCNVYPSNVDKKSYEGEVSIRLCNYTDVYYHEAITAEMTFMEATASPQQIDNFALHAGDVIITKDSETPDDIGISALVPDDLPDIVCGYHLALVRPRTATTNGAFVKQLFDAQSTKAHLETSANGLTRFGLSQYAIDNLTFAWPRAEEQLAIAAFLDRETGKIDALVAKQEKLIVLLKEKRQALISHAVTKGLNPDSPMKDSGIDWVGDVPANWTIGGLTKFIGPVVDYRGRTPAKLDEGTFLVTARNIRDGAIDYAASEEFVDPDEAAALLARGAPEVGDVLFTTEAPLGEVAQVDRTDIALAQRVVKFRGTPGVMVNRYLMYWLMSSACQSRLETLATGSTALGIKASKLGMIECLAPPCDEQQAIVIHIDKGLRVLESLQAEAERAIALLKERRSALISAAVTGKIDVRGTPTSDHATEEAVA